MKILDKYAPSFYGKDAAQKLDTWTSLLSDNDFASLISGYEYHLKSYISCLRKAEIFGHCPDAKAALECLKTYICWEEDFLVNYTIFAQLPFFCESVDDFVAHSTKRSTVSEGWVVGEFYQCGGGDHLDWEVAERFGEAHPGEVSVTCLSLVGAEERHYSAVPAV
jgi:hypothetical protein